MTFNPPKDDHASEQLGGLDSQQEATGEGLEGEEVDGADMEMLDAAATGDLTKQNGAGSSNALGAGRRNEEPLKPNKERVTTPYLTKYERARILGTRALQIR